MASRASGNTPVPDTAASSGASTRTEQTNRTNQSRSRRGRGNKNNGGSVQSQGSNDKKFQGQEESLKECTFDYSEDPQSRRYIKNIELLVGYIGSTFKKHNPDYQKAVEQLRLDDPPPAQRPADTSDMLAVEEWKFAYKAREEKLEAYSTFRAALYSLLWGQCTPLLKDKLKACNEYGAILHNRDGIELLRLIKKTTFTHDSSRIYTAVSRDRLKEEFYGLRRKKNQSIQSYYEVFRAKYKVIQELGIVLYDLDFVQEIAHRENRTTPIQDDYDEAQERCAAVRFIRTSGQKEYESHLQNCFLDNQNHYPASLADARAIIDNRMSLVERPRVPTNTSTDATGVAYHTTGDTSTLTGMTLTTNGQGQTNGTEQPPGNGNQNPPLSSHVNTSRDSPNFVFSSASSQANIPPNWILLDNQSTIDIIINPHLVKNIHTSSQPITVTSHAGKRSITEQALLPGYGLVWFDRDGPANILALHTAQRRFNITYNSSAGNTFDLSDKATGRLKHRFKQSAEGLFYLDAKTLHHDSFLTTVKANEELYTDREVSRAQLARKVQAKIGRPSTREYVRIVDQNKLPNAPFTSQDIRRAEKLYGPDLGSLKGKTPRRKSPLVVTEEVVPPAIKEEHKDLTLAMDIMHVNGIAFMAMTTRKLHFTTIDALPNTQEATIMASIKRSVAILRRGGLRPRMLLFDRALAFDGFEQQLAMIGMKLNTTAREEHVGDVERFIRTVKDRMRSAYTMLPFKAVPRAMVIELAKFVVFWLNSFPHPGGISQDLSPRYLVTGEQIDYNKHCKYEFGQYVQCHEPHNNTMQARTIGAIALRPTGNRQGSYYFLSLESGRIIVRNHVTPLPMPSDVITRVENLAAAQEMQPGLVFGNHDNRILMLDPENPLLEDDEDDPYLSDEDDSSVEDALRYDDDIIDDELADVGVDEPIEFDPEHSENQGVNSEQQPNLPLYENQGVEDVDGTAQQGGAGIEADEEDNVVDVAVDEVEQNDDGEELAADVPDDIDEGVDGVEPGGANDSMEIEFAEEYDVNQPLFPNSPGRNPEPNEQASTHDPESSGRYNLRPNRTRSYAHRFGHNFACLDSLARGRYDGYLLEGVVYLVSSEKNLATPQMPMKKGLKVFGNLGVEAVRKEMQQLHDRGVLKAVYKSDLTWDQVRKALGYLMYLKRKRCGKIKGRGCADGRPQRAYIDKEDSSSPTVSTDAVFYTAIIDAVERRHVVIADIPGAFMHSDMDPNVHMRLDGILAELLLEIAPETYLPYVTYEKGKPVIYVEMLKALYGTLRAARLFWERLTGVLISWGFVINPYDHCVANKWINDRQCTITWHIDDLKISHVNEKVVDQIVEDLRAEFGRLGEISVSKGKRHDYLGMFLDFTEDGVLQVDMRSYLDTILEDLPKAMKGRAKTPASEYLHLVRDTAKKLSPADADLFHSWTAQLAYLSQRGRPDIRTAVAFLSTRVSQPDQDDWLKLIRVFKYLQATRELILRLESDENGILKWWVDASYATHPDMKGHTGGCMTMGKGIASAFSAKQKLVSRSSTESELIGIHDVMPNIIWSRNFLEAQGVEVKDVVLHQDNKSSILLAKNGRLSSSKRTKHINVRYFFVKDRIAKKELSVQFCPTEDMIADFFTKPLQGQLFYRLRDQVMNIESNSPFHSSRRSVLEPAPKPIAQVAESATGDVEAKWNLVQPRGKATKKSNTGAHSLDKT